VRDLDDAGHGPARGPGTDDLAKAASTVRQGQREPPERLAEPKDIVATVFVEVEDRDLGACLPPSWEV
jgi:hypothetical protein